MSAINDPVMTWFEALSLFCEPLLVFSMFLLQGMEPFYA